MRTNERNATFTFTRVYLKRAYAFQKYAVAIAIHLSISSYLLKIFKAAVYVSDDWVYASANDTLSAQIVRGSPSVL